MKKHLIFGLFFTLFFAITINGVKAQSPYQTALGARLGSPLAVSLKHFVTENNAVEVYGGFRSNSVYNWFSVSAAYQIHNDLSEVTQNLRWYYGAGVSAYFWSYDDSLVNRNDFNSTSFGLQGYLGLDYTLESVPVNLSVDWIPTIFLGDGYSNGFKGGYGALAVRYTLR